VRSKIDAVSANFLHLQATLTPAIVLSHPESPKSTKPARVPSMSITSSCCFDPFVDSGCRVCSTASDFPVASEPWLPVATILPFSILRPNPPRPRWKRVDENPPSFLHSPDNFADMWAFRCLSGSFCLRFWIPPKPGDHLTQSSVADAAFNSAKRWRDVHKRGSRHFPYREEISYSISTCFDEAGTDEFFYSNRHMQVTT
jgi:hypothetical protein